MIAGALGFNGDIDQAQAALVEALALKPQTEDQLTFARVPTVDHQPGLLGAPRKTVNVGLRRTGFSER
jgi:hypothetical protein